MDGQEGGEVLRVRGAEESIVRGDVELEAQKQPLANGKKSEIIGVEDGSLETENAGARRNYNRELSKDSKRSLSATNSLSDEGASSSSSPRGIDSLAELPPSHHTRYKAKSPRRPSRSKSLDCLYDDYLSSHPDPDNALSILPSGLLFGLDIGGTLGKICFREPFSIAPGKQLEQINRLNGYFRETNQENSSRPDGPEEQELAITSRRFGGTLRFITFEARSIEYLFEIIRKEKAASPDEVENWKIFATGGGSVKYEASFFKELGAKLEKSDEMETIVSGVQCLIENVHEECFTWMPTQEADERSNIPLTPSQREKIYKEVSPKDYVKRPVNMEDARKPWLIVNCGSGVSMLKLDEQQTVEFGRVSTYKRVGGTPLGGGTFLALGCLLTGVSSHQELLELAEKGNAKAIDKLVGDIYGDDYKGLGLSADTVAACFGKLVNPDLREAVKKEDLAASLIQMISWNIAHVARLVATQEGIKTIIFTGSFMHANAVSQKAFAHAFRYWSSGDSRALFMKHEGYVGAVGALAMSNLKQYKESYNGSHNGSPG